MDAQVTAIAGAYRQKRPGSPSFNVAINELYTAYIRKRETTVLDAASSAASLGTLLSVEHGVDKLTPEMREAFSLAFPHTDPSVLEHASPEQLAGYASAWKGKLFEVVVRDRLNDGQWVGDLHLGPHQVATLAESATQPGWDLHIQHADGSVGQELQLKATKSLSYVKSALEKYPHIDILTTDDIISTGAGEHIHNTGISLDTLDHPIDSHMQIVSEHSYILDFVHDIAPAIPFVIIVTTEGRHLLAGRKSFQHVLSSIGERSLKTGTAVLVGKLVILAHGGWLCVPAAIATRMSFDRHRNLKQTQTELEDRRRSLEWLYNKYKIPVPSPAHITG